MVKKRFSEKREAVLNNLKQRTDHPSATMVYDSLRREYPTISLGTVYRNLNELAEDGKIVRFTHGGKEHFDGHINPHYHFCCESCGKIFDISADFGSLPNTIHELIGAQVDRVQIVATGRCKACL